MNKRPGETTIRTSIRIRPCSQQEKETFPGPSPVQAAPGEVRLFHKQYVPGSGRNSPSNLSRSRPATPTNGGSSSPHVTPRGASSPSLVWRQQAAAQLSGDYQSYPFANVFGPEEDNEDVYNGSGCRDVVGAVLGGCNGTIFVYGQTGAGKTYTMDAVTDLVLQQLYVYAAADDSSSEVAITVSAVELYNEVLRCLLSGRENLQLRWASGAGSFAGVVLEGAEERSCGSIEEAAALVTMAKASRAVGETRANARSSRSHLIVRIKVEVLQLGNLAGASPSPTPASNSPKRALQAAAATKGGKAAPASVTFSMLNLVDLAGSERIDKSGSADTPLRLREALNINKSLLCLGNVVTALAERSEGKRGNHIPYRDSKLTRLLEDSLGGNATTALVACITLLPEWHLEQSRNTLEFAARAARIVCKPLRNVLNLAPAGPSGEAANLIASLQAEVEALKKQLAQQQQQQQQQQQLSSAHLPQLHALPVQPVSCSNALWDGSSVFAGRHSGVLAGVAESSAEAGDGQSDSSSPTSASCPTSPSGRHSPPGRRGWTNRLRMTLNGGGIFSSFDASSNHGLSIDPKGSKSLLHSPGRITSPKHSLFSLGSPRFGRASAGPLLGGGLDQPVGCPSAAAAEVKSHPVQPSAGGVMSAASESGATTPSGAVGLPPSAHTTSIISRASGTQKFLLWKLLQQPHPHTGHTGSHALNTLDRISSSGGGSSPRSHSPHSLKSTGLLITSSGNAVSAAAAVAASGVVHPWAAFGGGRASTLVSGALPSSAGAHRAETHDGAIPSYPLQLSPQASGLLHTGRTSIASRRLTTDGVTGTGASLLVSSHAAAAGQVGLDSSGSAAATLESRVTAAEAAMTLRDHIIKQLVLALQQKKAEIRSLKEQLAGVLQQLESAEGEEASSKAKLRELAEGFQMLAAARQAEFEKWKGHLVGLESALQAAQREATNHRDESQSLVQQLAALQGRYNSLQTEQHNSLATVSLLRHQHQEQQHQQQHNQLAACLSRLQAIEAALQEMLRMPSDAVTGESRGVTPRQRGSRPCTPHSPRQLSFHMQQQVIPEHAAAGEDAAAAAAAAPDADASGKPAEAAGEQVHVKGGCASHMIQTVTTRVFDSSSGSSRLVTGAVVQPPVAAGADLANSLAAAAEEAAAAARLSHAEFVLAELQELMPLLKAAADAAVASCSGTAPAAATAAAGAEFGVEGRQLGGGMMLSVLGNFPRQSSSVLQTGGMVDNTEGKQHDQAVQTKEIKASLAGGGLLSGAAKCPKCESLKPLLVIMQKLKDEVVLLKAAVRSRDADLAAAEDREGGVRADLKESRQQVGALRERIDELSEDLELARTAAAAAAGHAPAPGSSRTSPAGGVAVTATAAADNQQQQQQPQEQQQQRPPSPGQELSELEVAPVKQVPLMGEDTPLEALHAQILQSWQVLAMPFAYRCAFVLGPNSVAAAIAATAISNGTSSSNRMWGSSSGRNGADDSPAAGADSSSSSDGLADAAATALSPAAAAAAGVESQQAVRQAPWSDRVQCQAHIALLACLHQYHEDEPAAAEQQREVLEDEARVMDAGLALLPAGHFTQLLKHWGISTPGADADSAAAAADPATATATSSDTAAAAAAAQRADLLAQLWVWPGAAATAESLASDSAAASQLALQAAPPAQLAAVSLRCNASVIAAASNALADAAS